MTGDRIVRVDTVRHRRFPRLVHVILHAADGATGLGETFWAGHTVRDGTPGHPHLQQVLRPRPRLAPSRRRPLPGLHRLSRGPEVRTLLKGAFREIVDVVPEVVNGRVAPTGPGHGCSLTTTYLAEASMQTAIA